MLSEAEKAWELDLRNFKSWKDTKITADVSSWNNEEWHQLAVTWQEKGNKILYIDGAKVSEGVYHLTKMPTEIMFGSPKSGVMGMIDEVRILNKILSPEEIQEDYKIQMNGTEFSVEVPSK